MGLIGDYLELGPFFGVSDLAFGVRGRFPPNPLIMKVPFFLTFCFNRETPKNKEGKRVLLG